MNRGVLVLSASIIMLLAAAVLQGAGVERYQLPVETADGRVFTQEDGVAQASVYSHGQYALHAAAYKQGDEAIATAIWETTTVTVDDAGQARAVFRLGHTSGARGIEWWGQLCCYAVATPYVITPEGHRLEGAATRLDGVPPNEGAEHLLQALDTMDGSRWLPEAALEAAATLAEAAEDHLVEALAQLLQTLDGELALVVLTDALDQRGYLRMQEVEFGFNAAEEGIYTLGMQLETWACPLRSAGNLAWSLGVMQWVELEIVTD
ncbi:MAG: hypothetical protein R6U88_00015 [Candidatus Bipolaricaulota bacterium]